MAREFPIIRKLGGRFRVVPLLKEQGHEISEDGVRMWAARGSIPGGAARILMKIADYKSVAYDARDFELGDEPAEAPSPHRTAGGMA